VFNDQCAHCGSFDTVAGLNLYQCLKCGYHTDAAGNAVAPPPPSEPTTWYGRRNIDGGRFDDENGEV